MNARNLFFPYGFTFGPTDKNYLDGGAVVPVWDFATWDSDPIGYVPDSPYGPYSIQLFYPAMSNGAGGLTRVVCGKGTKYSINAGPNIDVVMKYYWRAKTYHSYSKDDSGTVIDTTESRTNNDTILDPTKFIEQNLCGTNYFYPYSLSDSYVKGTDGNYWMGSTTSYPGEYNLSKFGSYCLTLLMGPYDATELGPPNTPVQIDTQTINNLGVADDIYIYFMENTFLPPAVPPVPANLTYGYYDFTDFFTYDGYYNSSTGDPA